MCHGVFFFLFWCLWVVELRGYWVFIQFSSVQSLSRIRLFATPRIAAHQASLSVTNSRSLLKLMSIELVMPSNHLILCRPLLLPSIFPSIRVFSNKSTLHIRWSKYWSFSFNISLSNEHIGLNVLVIMGNIFLLVYKPSHFFLNECQKCQILPRCPVYSWIFFWVAHKLLENTFIPSKVAFKLC